MSNRSDDSSTDSGQLFQNMDQQEQVYAPDQVPGNRRVAADDLDTTTDQSDAVPSFIPAVPPGGITAASGGGPPVLPVVPVADQANDEDVDRRDNM